MADFPLLSHGYFTPGCRRQDTTLLFTSTYPITTRGIVDVVALRCKQYVPGQCGRRMFRCFCVLYD